MKKLAFVLCLGLMAAFFTTTASAGTAFPDVDDDAQYAGAVELTKEKGLFSGDDNGNFNPNANITRAEFATVVYRMLAGDYESDYFPSDSFADVPSSHWAFGCIAWANSYGIINGYGNGNFGPSDSVTYEQAIKMLLCALEYGDAAVDAGGYPYGYISIANDLGLLEGVEGSVGEAITRANIAILLARCMEL